MPTSCSCCANGSTTSQARGATSQTLATDVAEVLFVLGRVWEAEAWSAVATTLSEEPSRELAGLREEIVEQLRRDSGWFAKDTPALAIDLSFLPEPRLDSNWEGPKRPAVIPTRCLSRPSSHVRAKRSLGIAVDRRGEQSDAMLVWRR